MEPILQFAERHGLKVIEDAAQALGAQYTFSDGRKMQAGTMGDFGTTSFFPSKNLGCYGDGGAIFTNQPNLAEQAEMICNHGQKRKYYHDIVGVNSRLDTIQAAILKVKLKYLPKYENARQSAAKFYDQKLSNIKGIAIPKRNPSSSHVFHQYTIRCEKRDDLKSSLQEKGIPSMIYYPMPLHLQKAYRIPKVDEGSFPVSENLSRSVLSLPIHTEMDHELLEYICAAIISFYHA
jgi:dTDP-4-amino-4,6-dideoxygalactose transaminase